MSDTNHSTILRRMMGQQRGDTADNPPPSSRAIRLALTKSANDVAGLVMTVTGMTDSAQPLDTLIAELDPDLMLMQLEREGRLVGLMALNMQMRAAVLEMHTVGEVLPVEAETRVATSTDKLMCEPFLGSFLESLPEATFRTEFEGWADDVIIGEMIPDSRVAGLILDNREYRLLDLTIDLGASERVGRILVVLPAIPVTAELIDDIDDEEDWNARFQASVSEAPACLDAILHNFEIPLGKAQSLKVGDVLPLLGCTVSSVRLMSSDQQEVGQAKLGQMAGKRAVRIEEAVAPQIADLVSGAPLDALPNEMDQGEDIAPFDAPDVPLGLPDNDAMPLDFDTPEPMVSLEEDGENSGEFEMAPMDMGSLSFPE